MSRELDEVIVGDAVVVKRHGGDDGQHRASVAATAMTAALRHGLPVPEVLDVDGRTLRARAVRAAVGGRRLLMRDPEVVLSSIAAVASRLRPLAPPDGLPTHGGSGRWIHGDLCPANLLFAADTVNRSRLVAVVDWDESRGDDPLVDLVWTEWLLRVHHPEVRRHLPALYAGAPVPAAERRRAVMRRVLERQLVRDGPTAEAAWRAQLVALPGLDLDLDRGRDHDADAGRVP